MINLIELLESRLKARLPSPKLGCCWQVVLFTTGNACIANDRPRIGSGREKGEVGGKVSK